MWGANIPGQGAANARALRQKGTGEKEAPVLSKLSGRGSDWEVRVRRVGREAELGPGLETKVKGRESNSKCIGEGLKQATVKRL